MALEELPGKSSYFVGNDPKKWRTRIPTYLRVKYEKIYPGIDLVFHGDQGQLEYDFIVAPGADPSAIQLSFSGAGKLSSDDHGNLIVRTTMGDDVIQYAPILYQEVDGIRKTVNGRYVLKGGKQVGFQAADYDSSKPLIVDPVLSYSTYFGTEWGDAANRIAVDADGNAYVIVNVGNSAAEVLKLNASGTAIMYAVWLGGTAGGSSGQGIAVDRGGNAYIAGRTESNDFPTVNPFQRYRGVDAFVTKINPAGDLLVYSSYLGGSSTEELATIAIDDEGNAYVAGKTFSWDFPTVNAFQSTLRGPPPHGFVAKVNAQGDALVYSTYLGGSSNDAVTAIAVDAAGNVYLTGQTFSPGFPTAGGLQPNYGGGGDAFVTKINAAGSGLAYSTYLGGTQADRATGLALDPEGSVYVVGVTESRDFPTVNSFQPFTPPTAGFTATNGFITKINVAGDGLVYSSFFLGAGSLPVSAIAVDASGNAYITGTAGGPGGMFRAISSLQEFGGGECFASTAFISEPIRRPCFDAFVAKINVAGNAVLYSSYLGGSSDDSGLDIALDKSRNVYVTGSTSSNNFPTVGAIQASLKPPFRSDAFIAKIAEPQNPPCTLECVATTSSSGRVGEPLGFSATTTSSNCTDAVAYEWNFGDGTPAAAGQTASHAYISGGTFTWKVTASVAGAVVCSKIGTIRVIANPRRRP